MFWIPEEWLEVALLLECDEIGGELLVIVAGGAIVLGGQALAEDGPSEQGDDQRLRGEAGQPPGFVNGEERGEPVMTVAYEAAYCG